jgi:hypothetical protein
LEQRKLYIEEGVEMKQKKQFFAIRVSPGIFDWCSPEEFKEGLKLYLDDYWDKMTEKIKNEKENRNTKK